MVEIIHRGEIPEDRWYEHRCTNCQTRFKFQKFETRSSGDQRDFGWIIDCPLCKKQCWMSSLKPNVTISYSGGDWRDR